MKQTTQTEKSEQSKFSLTDWLTCKDELIKLGITTDEIEQALKDVKYTVRDLTDEQEFTQEPTYYGIYELVKDWHTAQKKEHITLKGRCFESCDYVSYSAQTYRIKGHYQGLKHGKLIHQILSNRLPWFKSFKWEIFEMYSERNPEIYLKTKKGSVYVPIKALLEKDSKMIIERMKDYFLDYSRLGPYSLNHLEGESEDQYKQRREKEMIESLKPLQSATYKRLEKCLV